MDWSLTLLAATLARLRITLLAMVCCLLLLRPAVSLAAGPLDHFAWSPVSSPQVVNQPFGVTITAEDTNDATVSYVNFAIPIQALVETNVNFSMIEDFESGVWPHAPWLGVSGPATGTLSTNYAHDGNYGLSDPYWIVQTNVNLGHAGDVLSCWIRASSSTADYANLGFDSSVRGCWSVVAEPNSSQFAIQNNNGFYQATVVSTNQTWQTNKWYKMAVEFLSTNSVICNLYDSDGATLLNSLSYTNVTAGPGGVALYSYGGFSLDTIASGGLWVSPIPMSPTSTGNLANGVWSGNVTILQPATNVVLYANPGFPQTGTGNGFAVILTNDVGISLVDTPHPVNVGSNLTYTITVTNTGPAAANSVVVTNVLPANATFISAVSTQGTCGETNNLVTCNVGQLPGGTGATLTIGVVPTTLGATLTDTAGVSRAELDPYPANNFASVATPVVPIMSITDASNYEGNVGISYLNFFVTLNSSFGQPVSVSYATADGTATVANNDYIPTNGTVTFPPGAGTQNISVGVVGNTIVQPNKTFYVNLSNPVNATLSRTQAVGTIINDDGLPGNVDHFVWSAISSPQITGTPFAVTITAQDAFNNPATNYNGTATLKGTGHNGGVSLGPTSAGPFVAGVWNGALTLSTVDTNIILTATDNNGHTNSASPFYTVGTTSTLITAPSRRDMVEDTSRGLLYITITNQVLRYALTNGTMLSPFVFGTNLYGIDISPDNNTLVVADGSGFNGTNCFYVVDLPSGTNRMVLLPSGNGSGTFAVAFGNDGAAVLTTIFSGSGFTPMIRYDPVAGTITKVATPTTPSVVNSCGDGHLMAVAEGNIDSGPIERYNVASQGFTGSAGTGAFIYEVGINRDGSQYCVPTPGGSAFLFDTNLQFTGYLGSGSSAPIGVAYDPGADLAFDAWFNDRYLHVYETHTMALAALYDCGVYYTAQSSAFNYGRVRVSRDRSNVFATVFNGVRWFSRYIGPAADLGLSLSSSPIPVDAGGNLTYTITVTNAGPNSVLDGKVFDALPGGVSFVSATSPQGPCTLTNNIVTCVLAPLTNGATATVSIVVVPPLSGGITNVASVISSAADANPANNWASLVTLVQLGGLQVTPTNTFLSFGPQGGPFLPGSQIYSLTNAGNTSLTWSATDNVNWISLSPTNGTLAAGTVTTLVASINTAANSLARGVYNGTILCTNTSGGPGTTNVSVTLTVNTAPVATPQTVSLPADASTVVTLQGTDADGDPLQASITALPAIGTLYLTSDGVTTGAAIESVPTALTNSQVILILPPQGFGPGAANFQFDVNDGLTNSPNALVTVNVTDVPVAVNDSVAFLAGTPQVSFNVLNNDSDVDGGPLTVQSFTLPAYGTLTETNNGQFVYQPNPTFINGQDQFSYTITNMQGGAASAQVTITVYTNALGGGDWQTFGAGPSHTGYYPGVLGNATFVANWSTNLGINVYQAAVGGGRIYVTTLTATEDIFAEARDAVTGQELWHHDFGNNYFISPPTYSNGRVYAQSSSENQLWSLNAADGSVAWNAGISEQAETDFAPTVAGANVWIEGGEYNGMYGFNTNGTEQFFFSGLPQYGDWSPTWFQGGLYTWMGGTFRAHDPLTGNVLWSENVGRAAIGTEPAVDGGLAFVQDTTNLVAVDLSARTNSWTFNGQITASPAVANGIAYVIVNNTVEAFCARNGTSLGVYQDPSMTGIDSQPIVTDDSLFVSAATNTYIFNLASHQLVQTIPCGGNISLANGRLYVTGTSDYIGAIHTFVATNLLDHFAWNPIPTTRYVNLPFSVILQAEDAADDPCTNFIGSALLSSTNGVPISPAIAGAFNQGSWTGTVTISQPVTNLVLRVADGTGKFGLANVINVVPLPSLAVSYVGSQLNLAWPTNSSAFVLETTPSLSTPNWLGAGAPTGISGGQFYQQIPAIAASAYYRLRFIGP